MTALIDKNSNANTDGNVNENDTLQRMMDCVVKWWCKDNGSKKKAGCGCFEMQQCVKSCI